MNMRFRIEEETVNETASHKCDGDLGFSLTAEKTAFLDVAK